MKVHIYINKQQVLKLLSSNGFDNKFLFLLSWMKESYPCIALIVKNEQKNILSFALLHRVDYDEFSGHNNPYLLNYIYTYEKYRRSGVATLLLSKIKKSYQTTTFAKCNESIDLFNKAGFKLKGVRNECLTMQFS